MQDLSRAISSSGVYFFKIWEILGVYFLCRKNSGSVLVELSMHGPDFLKFLHLVVFGTLQCRFGTFNLVVCSNFIL